MKPRLSTKILKYLVKQKKPKTVGEIAKALGEKKHYVNIVLRKLTQEELIGNPSWGKYEKINPENSSMERVEIESNVVSIANEETEAIKLEEKIKPYFFLEKLKNFYRGKDK